MQFTDRSYGGKLFRPKPDVYFSDDQNIMIIATPWGPPQAGKEFIEYVLTHLRESEADPDRTVAFVNVDTMDHQENRVRMAILAAHEDIKDKYNEEQITAGVEVLCLCQFEKKISWFQVGAPFTSIIRENKLIPLHHPIDLSFDLSMDKSLPPLPKELIGLQNHVHLEFGSFRVRKSDKILLIGRSYVPYELFGHDPSQLTLESVTTILAQENEEHPFWIGWLEIN